MKRALKGGEKDDPLKLIRFVGRHALNGAVAGWVIMLALMQLDIGGLGTLVREAESRELITAMMAFSFGLTFALVGLAWGVLVILPETD